MSETRWRDPDQTPCQLFGRLMRILGKDDLIECLGGLSDRFHDDGMPVAVGNYPPGGDHIENRTAVFINEISTVGFDDSLHRWFQRVLGKGVPDRG